MYKSLFTISLFMLSVVVNLSAQQNKGMLSNLVCFVRFADEDASVFDKSVTDYESLFNAEGTSNISVYNYFNLASYNQLSWKSVLYPVSSDVNVLSFQASHSRSYYQHYTSINTDGYDIDNAADVLMREQSLVKEISDYLNTIVPQDANIDANGDGVVDNICIILSGNSEISAKYLLWPHRSTLYIKSGSIASKKVNEYIVLFDGANGWNSFNPIQINAGVLCHEMSHTLGTRDLYHTLKGLNPVGVWDLMSDNLTTPQGMSAYTKYKYCEWIDEIPEISEPGVYTLNPVGGASKDNVAYKIKLPDSDEYFVLEYRKRSSPFENGLPASGLLIYRINPNFTGNDGYDGSSKFDEQYLFRPGGSITADGNISEAYFSSESGRTAFGGAASVKPFYHDGTEANFAIANIGSCGDNISFELLPFSPQIILSQKEVTIAGELGSTCKVQVKAVNTDWEAKNIPDWLNISTLTGAAGTTDFIVTTESKNEQFVTRTGTILFQSTKDANVSIELRISQFSAIIQSPYSLTGSKDGSSINLSWERPIEGSAVLTEDFENIDNRNLWTIQTVNNVGWVWQEKEKYKLPYDGNYSARLNSEFEDRHQDERLVSPKFANAGRLFFYSNSIAPLKVNAHNFYYVEISNDNGATWNKIFDLKTQGTAVNKYERIEVDLSEHTSDNMLIAFHAYDDNNMGLSYWWHVDNIEVYPRVTSSVVKEYHIYRNGEKIGTSTDCSFTDMNPVSGSNVYKVKAVGDFGETIFSNEFSFDFTTGVAEHAAESGIRMDVRRDVIHL